MGITRNKIESIWATEIFYNHLQNAESRHLRQNRERKPEPRQANWGLFTKRAIPKDQVFGQEEAARKCRDAACISIKECVR